ncbi:MAG: FAD-dependent oxidoreductase [Patescibacteria group bacterium]|mgnify:CR=1 FL=1
MYDLLIIGGGPGGVAAGIYAARKKIVSALITEGFGGQSLTSDDIQNWIGSSHVSGLELANMLEEHLRAQEGIEIIFGDRAEKIEPLPLGGFLIGTRDGKSIEAKYILLASGSHRKRLGVPGEKEFEGKGVAFCATCDAPLFKDKAVAVVGGGNSGLESVIDLMSYASKVYLLVRSEAPKGDPVTLEKLNADPKVEVLPLALTTEIKGGESGVTGLLYKNAKTGEEKEIAVQGVFVEVGSLPNSEFVKNIISLNERGEVLVDHKTQQTSNSSIWAVGDVTDLPYRQNNISAGDGVKAILNIYERMTKEKKSPL